MAAGQADPAELGAAARRLAIWAAGLPHDPGPRARLVALSKALSAAPPAVRADAAAALAEGFAADPGLAHDWRGTARRAALEAQVADAAWPETLTSLEGLRRDAAHALLARVDAEARVAPDWNRLVMGGDEALGWLMAAPAAQARWPELHRAVLRGGQVDGLAAAQARLDAAVAALQPAGPPEALLVSVWVDGALAALDPWTRAVWPATIRAWQQGHAGYTVGVGLELALTADGRVRVRRPEPGAPAWGADLRQDDVIVRIQDGGQAPIDPMAWPPAERLDRARAALEGEEGSVVTLTRERAGAAAEVPLRRAAVPLVTVEGHHRGPDNAWSIWLDPERAPGLAYVQVSAFRPSTDEDFDALLNPHLDEIQAVVLDLRGNPGGDMDAAVQIADRFVADGILCDLTGRVPPLTGPDVDPATGQPLAPWNAALPGHALEGVPVAVLVDADSASAAEILAGALQERASAWVIGAPTWGKGLSQGLRTSPDGLYALQLTNLAWTLPSGRQLHREPGGSGGLRPDLELALTPYEQHEANRLRGAAAALRAHADGTPLRAEDPGRREGMPPIDDDPLLAAAELWWSSLPRPAAGPAQGG
jgi:carboxyl-terminal processing protease